MYFLGIETSCDETSSAVLDDRLRILSSVVLSQDEIHAPYGGVVPELASRQHIQSIGYVVEESLQRAGLSLRKIDVYAVTQGPGLIGSLLVGLSFAKGLAFYFGKPLIPVDHLEAHIHSAFLENKDIPFPSLALLVSGGHTSLFNLEKKFHYQLIGRTRDDAAGEALDKIAKFLDLGYPGGPIIDNIKKKVITKDHRQFLDFLASFEKAVIRALLSNMNRAAKRYKPKSLIICGGVARNKKLRRDFIGFAQKLGLPCFIPSPELCTDNAAMVAALAADKFKEHPGMSFPFDLNAYPRM